MTSKFSAKIIEMFRNLKSDAVPRPPRNSNSGLSDTTDTEAHNENVDYTNQEEIFVEQDNRKKKKKKPKYQKSFSEPSDNTEFVDEDDRRSSSASSNVNTQASGNVINIVNSSNVRCGNEFVYYMGPVHVPGKPKTPKSESDDEEPIEKTKDIILLLETKHKPEHEYIDLISKNLGKNWHSFFRRLGYKQGQIETAEIDMAKHGVAEARYKLLLDWIRNDDDGTLGKLAKVLWEGGERLIVKELADIYKRDM